MPHIKLGLLLLLALQAPPGSAADKDREACARVKQQIRQIEARMRAGYSAAQGIRYDERLRQLKKKRTQLCR